MASTGLVESLSVLGAVALLDPGHHTVYHSLNGKTENQNGEYASQQGEHDLGNGFVLAEKSPEAIQPVCRLVVHTLMLVTN